MEYTTSLHHTPRHVFCHHVPNLVFQFPPTSQLSPSYDSYQTGMVKANTPRHVKLDECMLPNFCSRSITGQHNSLWGKHYLPSSSNVSSQIPAFGYCSCQSTTQKAQHISLLALQPCMDSHYPDSWVNPFPLGHRRANISVVFGGAQDGTGGPGVVRLFNNHAYIFATINPVPIN